jgi:mannobiose 2-epimerase
VGDVRLSEKDLNAPKSMNTHLHLLEAYTTLHRARPESRLLARVVELLELFLDRIVDPRTHHLRLFFEADWRPCSGTVSYGHEVEASWLLVEAARVVGEAGLARRVREAGVAMARAARREGQDTDGGLLNELHADGRLDADRHWWPQAEALVGFLHAFRETGERDFLDAALAVWEFTKAHVLDHRGGEWFGRVDRSGRPYPDEDKVGLWKCPYHNTRACLEGVALTEEIGAARVGAPTPGESSPAAL